MVCLQLLLFFLSCMVLSEPVVVYEMLKELATQLSIALFLGHDIGEEEAKEVSELMTTHWRGIISVPFSMRGPWSMWKSGFSKALAAKVQLYDPSIQVCVGIHIIDHLPLHKWWKK